MAQEIKVKVRLEDDEVKSKFSEDSKAVEGFGDSVKGAAAKVNESIQQQVRAAESIGNYRRQLRDTMRSIQNLSGAYAQLSQAEKQGDFGRALYARLQEVKKKGAELKDTISDINAEIKNLASDTAKFDAFKQGVTVGRDLMAAMVSTMQIAGQESEALQQMMQNLARVYTISNALITVGNALQKQSALMCRVRAAQERILAAGVAMRNAAEGKGIILTRTATAAQRVFNFVAKQNPLVLVATAILGAAAALAVWIRRNNEATKAEKERQAALKKSQEENAHVVDTMGRAIGNVVARYKLLRESYLKCRTEMDKVEELKKQKNAYDNLGLAINSVNDADEVFLKNNDKVIAALMARAKAQAASTLYQEKMVDWYKKTEAIAGKTVENGGKPSRVWKKGDKLSSGTQLAQQMGLRQDVDYITRRGQAGAPGQPTVNVPDLQTDELNELGAYKANVYERTQQMERSRQFNMLPDKWYEDLVKGAEEDAASKEAEISNYIKKATEKDKNKKTSTALPGSLKDLQQQLSKLEQQRDEGYYDNNLDEFEKKYNDLKKRIEEKKISLHIEPSHDSLPGIEKQIKNLQEKIKTGNISEFANVDEAYDALDALKQREKDLRVQYHLEPAPGSLADMQKQLSELQQNQQNGWVKLNPEDYKNQVTKLKKDIEKQEIILGIKSDPTEDKLKELEKQYQKITAPPKISSFDAAISEVTPPTEGKTKIEQNEYKLDVIQDQMDMNDDLLDSLQELSDKFVELGLTGEDAFDRIHDKMLEVQEANEELAKNAKSIEKSNKSIKKQKQTWDLVRDSVGSVGSGLMAISKASDDDKGSAVAGIIAEAIANVWLSFSQASTAAAQSGNPWIWIAFSLAAAAQTAAVVSNIKSATSGSYASGGVVRGSSYADNLTANVSAGEMILNQNQQGHLWRIVNGTEALTGRHGFNGEVDFRIQGSTLYGVLRNYGKEQKKLNHNIGFD